MKIKETAQEAAERIYPIAAGGSAWMPSADDCNKANKQEGFIEGAKWQGERMYSEEDMMKCWNAAYMDALSIDEENYKPLFFSEFINQQKKKPTSEQ
jgi:hypothetical protein